MGCQAFSNGLIIFSETYGSLIQTGAIVISALAAVLLILYTQRLAGKRATIDLLLQQLHNEVLVHAKKAIKVLREKKVNFVELADNEKADQNTYIQLILNNYEFIASGIRERAFDEAIYKRMHYSMVMKHWDDFEPYVMELRKSRHQPTLFQEFEWLGKRWKVKPLKKD